jgi:hypothetical protein
MPPLEIIRLITVCVGGGLAVAVGNWIHANRSARREREIARLQEQLRLLYGPLWFFTSQNEQLLKLAGSVQDAHQEFFTGKWSTDATTQSSLVEAGEATTSLSNMYVERVVENNSRVMAVLEANWHLTDLADVEIFSRFQVDYTRFLSEVKQRGRQKVPLQIMMKLGPIPFMHPDMIARVHAAVQQKQARLAELRS